MYVSSYLSLQTALSGVEAAQEEMATTSNNIANENTANYEEETVGLSATAGLTIADGNSAGGAVQLGTGVTATTISNTSDPYLDTAYRAQSSTSSNADTTESYTSQLQSLLGEDNDNSGAISSELSSYWSNWSSLSDNPNNAGAQAAVVNSGEQVATTINQLSSNITQLQGQAQAEYTNLTQDASGGQVYDDVNQLASLNASIKQATQGGVADNQLLDQRNAVIDDLSTLANVQTTNNSDGTVSLSFGGVTNLVQGTTVNWPSASASGTTTGTGGFTFPGDAASVGGKLGALLTFGASGGTADEVLGQLDGVSEQLANSVNSACASSGNGVTSFFSITTGGAPGTASASLAVTPALVANPAKVPVASSTASGANDIAVAVAQLSGGAPDQSYESLVESVGGITQNASNTATSQDALLTQVKNQKLSVEGVDNNEEMANLISEQQAYEASAKVMSTFSTMMDSLMQAVGG